MINRNYPTVVSKAIDIKSLHKRLRSLTSSCYLAVVFGIASLFNVSPMVAQNIEYTNQAVDLGLRSTQSVNPATLGVEFQIPLGHYRGRAGFDVPVVLSYSSKVWGMKYQGYNPGQPPPHGGVLPFTIITAEYAEHSVAGWTSTIGFPSLDFLPSTKLYDPNGNPKADGNCTGGCYLVDRIMVWMPDGSGHELRSTDQPRLSTEPAPDNLYSVDGSRMRYQRSTQTLFMPDGSRYIFPDQYVDRNGNKTTYVGGIKDTLDRQIGNPLPSLPGSTPSVPFDQSYSLPAVAGSSITYTLKWRHLADVLTTPEPLRYVADSACPPGTGNFNPKLFTSDSNGRTCIGNAGVLFNPVVLSQIVLQTGQSYTFTYDIFGTIDRVVLPTGAYEKYTYVNISPVSSPTTFRWVYAQSNRGVTNRTVSFSGSPSDDVHWLYEAVGGNSVITTAPDGTRTERYHWVDGVSGWGYSADSARAGRPYDERVYSAEGPLLRRKLTDWAITPSNASGNPSGTLVANRNARVVKEIEIVLDTDGDALAKTKVYGYDTAYQYSVGIEQTLISEYEFVELDQNTAQTVPITSINSIPTGTLLRTTETEYLTSSTDYRDRNLLGLPSVTRIRDAAGVIVAHTSFSYDEAAFPILTYGPIVGWVDPATTIRGNLTTTSRWLNFDGATFSTFPQGAYLTSHNQYDQCGNLRKTWDAKDTLLLSPAQLEYSSQYHFAYPTSKTSPDPDGNGPLTSLTMTTEYDISTGLVTATIDANNQRTTFSYNDPLNRIKQIIRASTEISFKNQTTYSYDDLERKVTVSSDLNTFNDGVLKTETLYDGMGRPREVRRYESPTNYIRTEREYDELGRVFKVSNPYRVWLGETAVWTTTQYDTFGRVISVTTPDNAVARTAYSGNRVLITDQNLRQRMAKNDSLGRLTDVWEITLTDSATEPVSFPNHPEVVSGYRTRYTYSALDDFLSATQTIGTVGTSQVRTFVYDSLKRLVSASNPENGLIRYEYDNNGNLKLRTDTRAPSVSTTYNYDNLNRLTSRTYSDGTPGISYAYDGVGVASSKGRLTSSTSSVSSTSYSYDPLGRVQISAQSIDGQIYSMAYGYDLAGSLRSQTYPSGRVVQTEYDNAGRIAGVKNQASGLFYVGSTSTDLSNQIKYSVTGTVSQMRLGNTLWEHTTLNLRFQPTQVGLGTTVTNSSIVQLDYGYGSTDNNGNVRSHTITIPGLSLTQVYDYDQLNRLESASENSGSSWKQQFSYDRFGNRRIDADPMVTSPDLVGPNPLISESNNRILAQLGEQYEYDGAGNLKKGREGQTYEFDGENRMTQLNGGAAQGGASYSYDSEGRRIKKIVGSVTTIFVYDVNGRLMAEYSTASPESNGTQYVTLDRLGSPRVITDANGTVKSRHDYHPFGEEIGLKGGRNAQNGYVIDNLRRKFTGQQRDVESGLDFFVSRYFLSANGRFASADSILGRRSSPQTLNRYAYVIGNPLRFVDPFGYSPQDPGKKEEEPEDICPTCIITTTTNQSKDGPLSEDIIRIPNKLYCIAGNCDSISVNQVKEQALTFITYELNRIQSNVLKTVPDGLQLNVSALWVLSFDATVTPDGDVFGGIDIPILTGWTDALVDTHRGRAPGLGINLTAIHVWDPNTRNSEGEINLGDPQAAAVRREYFAGTAYTAVACYQLCGGAQTSGGRVGTIIGGGTPGVFVGASQSFPLYRIPLEKLPRPEFRIPK